MIRKLRPWVKFSLAVAILIAICFGTKGFIVSAKSAIAQKPSLLNSGNIKTEILQDRQDIKHIKMVKVKSYLSNNPVYVVETDKANHGDYDNVVYLQGGKITFMNFKQIAKSKEYDYYRNALTK